MLDYTSEQITFLCYNTFQQGHLDCIQMYEYTTKCPLAPKLELQLLDHMAPECKLEYVNLDNNDKGNNNYICYIYVHC
jgi:hypothetical protein